MKIDYLADLPDCVPALAEWLHAEWDFMYPGATVETRAARLRSYLRRDGLPTAFVAHDRGSPLGTASLILSDMDSHPELGPWLASVYVTPSARACGIGAALAGRAMAEAARAGVGRLYLYTESARSLYERLGWKAFGRERYKGREVALMAVELGPAGPLDARRRDEAL